MFAWKSVFFGTRVNYKAKVTLIIEFYVDVMFMLAQYPLILNKGMWGS